MQPLDAPRHQPRNPKLSDEQRASLEDSAKKAFAFLRRIHGSELRSGGEFIDPDDVDELITRSDDELVANSEDATSHRA